MTSTYLQRQKLSSDPDEHSQLLRSMYMAPSDVEQALLQQQMADAARQSARYGRTFGMSSLIHPRPVSVPTEPDPSESYLADLPQRPKKPTFMLATDRRAAERVVPEGDSWSEEPEVLMPDDYHHSEARWKCLIRKETVLDVDGMEESRARDRRTALLNQQGLELEALLAEDDDPEAVAEDLASHPAHSIPKEEVVTLRYPHGDGSGKKLRGGGSTWISQGRAINATGYATRLKSPSARAGSSATSSAVASPSGVYAKFSSDSRLNSPTHKTTVIRAHTSAAAHAPPWQPQSAVSAQAQLQIQLKLAAAGQNGQLPLQSNAASASAVRYSAVGVPIGQTPPPPSQLQIPSRPGTSSGVVISLPNTPRDPALLRKQHSHSEEKTPHSPSVQASFPSTSLSPRATQMLSRISDREERRFREQERSDVFRLDREDVGKISPRKGATQAVSATRGQSQQPSEAKQSPSATSPSQQPFSPSSARPQPAQSDAPTAPRIAVKSPILDLAALLREAQAALAQSRQEAQELRSRLSALEASGSPNPNSNETRPNLPRPPSVATPTAAGSMSSPDEATSRALGRASLNLRQARRSLTEEKLKLMNEQVELAKQKESVEKDKMELIEQKKSLPPPPTMSPMPPPSSTQSPNDDAQGTMLRALARQNAALKTSRKSLTEEKLRWQNEFIKAQTEKQQAEEKATGLERRLSVSAGASPMFGPVSGHLQYPVGSPNSGDNLSLPPLPHQAHHEEEKTSSVLRAVRRQSLNLRRERQSLTEEKTKYMNEALALAKEKQEAQERVAELEKKLQESLQHLNTPTGSPIDGGASPNPSGLSTADSERLAAVQRASLAQLQRIKSARASARNSFHAEKDQLMKDTLRLEGEKAKTQEELQAKLQQLEADRQSHLQQITSQQESLRLEHLALQQEKSAMAAVKEAHAKAEKEILALRKSLEEEREKRMGESIKTASEVEQLHKQLDVERQKRAEDTAQLQAELARERQSRGEDSKRLESFSQASKSHTETLALVTHLQTTNSTLLAEVKGFQEAKHQLAEAQKRIGEREHELKKAFAAQDALENELREKREQLDVEQSAAREALQAELAEERLRVQEEMDMQRKRHEVALMEEVLNSRAAMNTAAQSMHSQHSLLWTQERETLLKLFEQDCEEQRQKLALEHHFHVSKERADLKTALNHLERERVKFENEKRRFHGNPAFREGGGVPRQQSAWGRPGSAAVQAAAEEHRATVAHQSQTAASLAHLSAAISSGFAGIQAVHQYPQRNELTIPDSPSNAQQARSESPQTATPRDGKPPAGPNSRLGTAANSSSRAPAS